MWYNNIFIFRKKNFVLYFCWINDSTEKSSIIQYVWWNQVVKFTSVCNILYFTQLWPESYNFNIFYYQQLYWFFNCIHFSVVKIAIQTFSKGYFTHIFLKTTPKVWSCSLSYINQQEIILIHGNSPQVSLTKLYTSNWKEYTCM